MRLFYSLGIYIYGLVIRMAALFSPKAKQWIQGRNNIFKRLKSELSQENRPLIWIHAASLGEFEQGRPVLEEIKKTHSDYAILLTFFSPSGYEVRKNYALADYIFYLPLDIPGNAKRFLGITQVKLAIFIKYEYWYNYLHYLAQKKIPLVFISAIFRPNQIFFKAYGKWFLEKIKKADWFFVQTQESLALLNQKEIKDASLSGDTRFDRVKDIANQAKSNALVQAFKGHSELLLAGSSWPEDEALIYPLLKSHPDLKIIFAPHKIDEKHLLHIENQSGEHCIRFSKATAEILSTKKVLIIDNYGLLSSLYRYADFTFIGGGFGEGIHNTLEAATFGMPIFIGPNYQKFAEAKDLIDLEVIHVVENTSSLQKHLNLFLESESKSIQVGLKAQHYVESKTGATQHILDQLKNKNLI
jgi:3-deoxy-D-manno-octulosonic-acid transferase